MVGHNWVINMLDKRLNFIEIEKKILAKWEKEKLSPMSLWEI